MFEGPKLNLDSKSELKSGSILDQLSYKMDCEIQGGFKNRDATEFLLIKPDNFKKWKERHSKLDSFNNLFQ